MGFEDLKENLAQLMVVLREKKENRVFLVVLVLREKKENQVVAHKYF